MRRNQSMWAYFLCLISGAALTLTVLPACGGGGGGETCNSPDNQVEGQEDACDAEEVNEEESDFEVEFIDESREETGIDFEEAIFELTSTEDITGPEE